MSVCLELLGLAPREAGEQNVVHVGMLGGVKSRISMVNGKPRGSAKQQHTQTGGQGATATRITQENDFRGSTLFATHIIWVCESLLLCIISYVARDISLRNR